MVNDLTIIFNRVTREKNRPRSDYRLHLLGELIALRVEQRNAQKPLMKQARERIQKSLIKNGEYQYLLDWKALLSTNWTAVKNVLTGNDEKSVELRQSIPFKNIITESERLEILLRSYDKPKSSFPKLLQRIADASKRIDFHEA